MGFQNFIALLIIPTPITGISPALAHWSAGLATDAPPIPISPDEIKANLKPNTFRPRFGHTMGANLLHGSPFLTRTGV
jgi:hypothetical protein